LVETLTESFCERCGTRYEFRAPTRLNPLRKTRGFIGGLKNYLTSQDDLSDALGDAMRSEEEQLASAQLEAFHESFNFCIDCRQYTCLNCWNDEAGRCRTCSPIAGTDDLAERLAASFEAPAADAVSSVADAMPEDELQRRLGMGAWPATDLPPDPAADVVIPVEWPTSDAVIPPAVGSPFVAADRVPSPTEFERPFAEPEPMVAEVEPEPMVAEVEPEPMVAEVEPEPMVAEVEPEPVTAERRPPLHVVAWEEDSLYATSVEPEPVAAEVEPEPEPVAAEVEPEPEPVAAEVEPEREPEPVAAEMEPEPEPEPEPPPRLRIAPISETILRFPTPSPPTTPSELDRPAAVDETPELAARRAQLELLGLGDPGQGAVAPERPAVLPYRSRGAAAAPEGAQSGGFWEASAREVAGAAAQIGVQNCGQCGLSLSANARFCRRCGTRQARSA
jgi:hypothetical protein